MARSGTRGPRGGLRRGRSRQVGQWIRPGCGTSLAFRDVGTGAGSRAATNLTGCAITRPARRRAAPGGGWTPASRGEGRPGHGPRRAPREGPMTGRTGTRRRRCRRRAAGGSSPRQAPAPVRRQPAAAGPGRPQHPLVDPHPRGGDEQRPGRDRLGQRERRDARDRAGGERVRDAERPGEEEREGPRTPRRAQPLVERAHETVLALGPRPGRRVVACCRHRVLHPSSLARASGPAADRSCRGRRSAGR